MNISEEGLMHDDYRLLARSVSILFPGQWWRQRTTGLRQRGIITASPAGLMGFTVLATTGTSMHVLRLLGFIEPD